MIVTFDYLDMLAGLVNLPLSVLYGWNKNHMVNGEN